MVHSRWRMHRLSKILRNGWCRRIRAEAVGSIGRSPAIFRSDLGVVPADRFRVSMGGKPASEPGRLANTLGGQGRREAF